MAGGAEGAGAAGSSPARAKTSVTSPLEVASSAGARASGWLKVGDGMWLGSVTATDGSELEIVELSDGRWRCVTDGTTRASLKTLLEAVLP
jgi:hypothetical protein